MMFGWSGRVGLVGGLCLLGCGDDAATTSAGSSTSGTTGALTSTSVVATTGSDDTTAPTSGISATGSGTTETSAAPTTGPGETLDTTTSTSSDTTTDETTGDDTTGPAPVCGDGAVDPGEQCDDGANNSDSGACTTACTQAVCGDGLVGPGEACDDADQDDADECTNTCALASCGDGVVQDGEDCDDADADDTDDCLATCVAPSCGDGFVYEGVEGCDDANADDSDDCTACQLASCDDAVANGGESDVDCGGGCPACGVDLACDVQGDCGDGLVCEASVCTYPLSCKALKAAVPDAPSGEVTIDLDGPGPEAPLLVYCEQTTFGGGWTRLMSAKYPHFFADDNWQGYNVGMPGAENYSIVGKRDLFKVGATYTYRYGVGDEMTWKDGPILFEFAWQQDHDAFTATTNGSDYTYLAGDKPTTCGGFNGLHNKYSSPSYATDVDQGDGIGCWWMQVVPRADWAPLGYPPGYLHGFLGGGNLNPEHETQWEVLYIRE